MPPSRNQRQLSQLMRVPPACYSLWMSWIAGVDGCPSGWFRICRETESGELRFDVVKNVRDLVRRDPQPSTVALDMPIGLPAAGDRACDKAARRAIGPRRSSVFPVPIRPAIAATTRQEASAITLGIDGRRVGLQTWAILPKIRSVDEALAHDEVVRATLREVHPEVSFWAWNACKAMKRHKKKGGLAERVSLAEAWLGPGILKRARGIYLKQELGDDDVVDAIAALWTAHRIAEGTATTLPDSPPTDETALPMEIVF